MNSTKPFNAAVIQMCASADLQADILRCIGLMDQAVSAGAQLITLPEICVGLDQRGPRPLTVACAEADHPALLAFSQFAREHQVEVLVGSLGINEGAATYNRSYLINTAGQRVAHYNKMHLFDIQLSDDVWFRESDSFAAGEQAVLAPCMGATAGMSICYDLRFPQLYRTYAQAGASLLFIPAAFTQPTGEAHWHSLMRARAIENGAWAIAPAQHGSADGGCFGHSLIIDPWGTIQAECDENEGFAVAEIDLSLVETTRAKISSLTHDKEIVLNVI